eukprot:639130_1
MAFQRISQTKDAAQKKLESQVRDKDHELRDLKQRIEIHQKQAEGLKQDYDHNAMENRKKISHLEASVHEWKTKFTSLNTAYETLQETHNRNVATCASFKNKSEELTKNYNGLVRQQKTLSKQNRDYQSEIDVLTAENITLTQNNATYCESLASLSKKIAHAAQMHAQKEHDLQRGMEKLRDELRKKKDKQRETEDATQHLTNSLDSANRIKTRFAKQIDKQKQDIILLRRQLEDTQSNQLQRDKYQTEMEQKESIVQSIKQGKAGPLEEVLGSAFLSRDMKEVSFADRLSDVGAVAIY